MKVASKVWAAEGWNSLNKTMCVVQGSGGVDAWRAGHLSPVSVFVMFTSIEITEIQCCKYLFDKETVGFDNCLKRLHSRSGNACL